MRATLAPLGLAALVLSGCSLLGGTSVEDLQMTVGECIEDPTVASEGEQEVGALPVVDCSEPHYGEVFYTEELTDASYPADASNTADTVCLDNFESYVGIAYADSKYYISSLYPTTQSWDAGDRQIACLLVGDAGQEFTSSAKGSAE